MIENEIYSYVRASNTKFFSEWWKIIIFYIITPVITIVVLYFLIKLYVNYLFRKYPSATYYQYYRAPTMPEEAYEYDEDSQDFEFSNEDMFDAISFGRERISLESENHIDLTSSFSTESLENLRKKYNPTLRSMRKAKKVRLLMQNLVRRKGNINDGICTICLEDMNGEFIASGQCGHDMHERCLKVWLIRSKEMTCPVCRHCLVSKGRESEQISRNPQV